MLRSSFHAATITVTAGHSPSGHGPAGALERWHAIAEREQGEHRKPITSPGM